MVSGRVGEGSSWFWTLENEWGRGIPGFASQRWRLECGSEILFGWWTDLGQTCVAINASPSFSCLQFFLFRVTL